MDKAVIYIHGKGGNAEEAIHYKPYREKVLTTFALGQG